MLAATIAGLTITEIMLGVEIAKWPGSFIDTLTTLDSTAMDLGKEALRFGGLALTFNTAWNVRYYLERRLIIGWRKWLTTQFGNAVLSDKSFMHLTNSKTVPSLDQRLAEDPDVLASEITQIYTGGLRSGLGLLAFTNVLYQNTGSMAIEVMGRTIAAPSPFFWASFAAALGCAAAGTVMLHKFGKPSVALSADYIRSQGVMRSNLNTMFSNSSEIASYEGQTVEKKNLQNDFENVRIRWLSFEKMQSQINGLILFNNDFSKLAAWAMGGLSYKLGHIVTTGGIVSYAGIFEGLRHAMAWPMQVTQALFKIRTTANFMTNFATNIELSKNPQYFYKLNGKDANITTKETTGQSIILNNIAVKDSANPEPLITVPHLEIKTGERILLTGQSGSGKSLLIRAIGGLWKFGEGEVTLPSDQVRLFVPQLPFVMGNMTLKENVIYPASDVSSFSDEQISLALHQAELGYLVPQLNDSDRGGTSWGNLSVGEKQRLIFARIFLHKPDMVFLDEATSGLDAELQNTMYKRLNEILPEATVVSIAHRDGLMAYHTRHLEVEDGALIDHGPLTPQPYQFAYQSPFPKAPLLPH